MFSLRHIIYLLVSLCLAALMSCEEGQVVPMRAPARADVEDVTNDLYLGDRHVGIYVTSGGNVVGGLGNVEYATAGGTLLQPASGHDIQILAEYGSVGFDAYAPYLSGMDRQKPVYRIDNWNRQDDPMSLDLLVADRVMNRSAESPDVKFWFRHVMSKIRLNFVIGDVLSSADLEDVIVTIDNMNRPLEYALLDHEVHYDATARAEAISMAVNEAKRMAWAILPSEDTMTDRTADRRLTICLKDGRTYRLSLPETCILQAGKCTTFNVVFSSQEEVLLQDCTIQNWEDTDMGALDLEQDNTMQP